VESQFPLFRLIKQVELHRAVFQEHFRDLSALRRRARASGHSARPVAVSWSTIFQRERGTEMKRLALAIMVVTPILGWRALVAQSHPPHVTAEFPGASLKWIHAAEPDFQREKLDLDKYTVSVVEENNSVTVSLSSLDSVPGARGAVERTRDTQWKSARKT